MADQYFLNFTDPLKGTFLINPFTSNGVISPVIDVYSSTAVSANTSLLYYGKGHPEYGERIQENILHLLEHFDGPTPPVRPIAGQLWSQSLTNYRRSNGTWYRWTGSTWITITVPTSPPSSPVPGNYYTSGNPATLWLRVAIESHSAWVEQQYMTGTGNPNTDAVVPERVLRMYNPDSDSWVATNKITTLQPTNPVKGLLWYNTTTPQLNVWNGSAWISVADRYLLKAGGTLTGFLTLDADPTSNLHAATKQYVDNYGLNNFVQLIGDTMTGYLTLNANPTSNLHAATKQYVDAAVGGAGTGTFVLLSGDTMTGDLNMSGGSPQESRILLTNGTASLPSLTFASDTNTGLYRSTTDSISLTTGGTLRLTISTSVITSTLPIRGPNGSVSTPTYSFSDDTNTGIYSAADDQLDISTDGALRLTIGTTAITPTLPVRGPNGSVSTPTYSFSSDIDTGMYRSNTNEVSFTSNGIRRLTIESNGTLNVAGTANYETLVSHDDDIPNKKYVDDAASGGGGDGNLTSGTYDSGIPAYQIVNLNQIGSPLRDVISTDPTGLANNNTVYSAQILIDGNAYNVDVVGQDAQTYSDLLVEINADLEQGSVYLSTGSITIESSTSGLLSSAFTNLLMGSPTPGGSPTPIDLWSSLSYFNSLATPISSVSSTISLQTSAPSVVSVTAIHSHNTDDVQFVLKKNTDVLTTLGPTSMTSVISDIADNAASKTSVLSRDVIPYSGSPLGIVLGSPLISTTPEYVVGTHRLWVFVNGVKYTLGDGYTENGTSGSVSTSVTWISPPSSNSRVEFIVI